MDRNSYIERLHSAFCAHTGQRIRLDMARERAWFEWAKMAHANWPDIPVEVVLIALLNHVKRGLASGRRFPGALKFSNLIAALDTSEEDTAAALAERRRPYVPPGKAKVLLATGRSAEAEQSKVLSAATVLEQTKLAGLLAAWKAQNL